MDGEPNRRWGDHDQPGTRDIRKTTTTMIQGQDANESGELRPYEFSVSGPAKTSKPESQNSLV